MFDSLFWMFKQENFRKHFIYLFSMYLFFILFSALLLLVNNLFVTDLILKFTLFIVSGVLFICPFLCFQGYFWCLTENIISRTTDIASSNVYNGKIREINKIELPEISTKRFIWRGIASIFATILLCYPFLVLLITAFLSTGTAMELYNFDMTGMVCMYAFIYVFIGLFIPALLWNYAKQDSIFAVWNFPKAIHIMGTYPGKYLWNTFLFLVLAFINYIIVTLISIILGLSELQSNLNFEFLTIAKVAIFFIIQYAFSIYWIYVNAYLLGTIAPPSES